MDQYKMSKQSGMTGAVLNAKTTIIINSPALAGNESAHFISREATQHASPTVNKPAVA
jgi:hypothetical protein